MDFEHLKNCELINQSCKQILQNPIEEISKSIKGQPKRMDKGY